MINQYPIYFIVIKKEKNVITMKNSEWLFHRNELYFDVYIWVLQWILY